MKPIIFAIIGKSGSGKSTLAINLENTFCNENIKNIVLDTTRPPRNNEVNGIDYNFLTVQEFFVNAAQCSYLNVSKYRDWWYGVNKNSIVNKCNILVATPKILKELLKLQNRYEIIPIYCRCSGTTRLKRSFKRDNRIRFEHLRRFVTDTIDFIGIEKIMKHFKKYVVVNTDIFDKELAAKNTIKYLKNIGFDEGFFE